jgi:hypothetical protein
VDDRVEQDHVQGVGDIERRGPVPAVVQVEDLDDPIHVAEVAGVEVAVQ